MPTSEHQVSPQERWHAGTIIRGPVLPEPVQVIRVVPTYFSLSIARVAPLRRHLCLVQQPTHSSPADTTLDRLHQAMILFAAGRSEALRRFLVEDGVGKDQKFWRLAQALCALYPSGTEERRWAEGVLARKKGLGF